MNDQLLNPETALEAPFKNFQWNIKNKNENENKNKNIRTPIISAEHCSALIGTRVIYLGFEKVFQHKQRHINSYSSNYPPPPIHVTNKANYNEVITQVISSSTVLGCILHKPCSF